MPKPKHTPDQLVRIALLRERVEAHDAHAHTLFVVAVEKAAETSDARRKVSDQRTVCANAERKTEWSGGKRKLLAVEACEGDKLNKLIALRDAAIERSLAATEDWMAAEKIAKEAAQDLAKAIAA